MGSLQSLIAAGSIALFGSTTSAVRLSPLLWIVPGFLALRALAGRGRPFSRDLAVLWLFPPAALFLAGVKARGGSLESLVLGLWASALLLHSKEDRPRRSACRCGLAGVLLGLALWTHDAALLFLPAALALLATRPRRLAFRLPAAAAGFLLGDLPLWLPRLVPFALGPPGTEGAGGRVDPALLLRPSLAADLFQAGRATLTTTPDIRGVPAILVDLYAAIFFLLSLAGVASWIRAARRARRPIWKEDAALALTLWLAAATYGALLATPELRGDAQWFRYTLTATPFLLFAATRGLQLAPARARGILLAAVALLGAHAGLRARSAWFYPPAPLRPELVRTLRAEGIPSVLTRPELAYYIRFATRDAVPASSYLPPRFPETNARVAWSPESWELEERPGRRTGSGAAGLDVASTFRLEPRRDPPAPDLARALAELDPPTILFARYEPFPLLDPGEYRRDWRGWPYRRPLERFQAIVWDPQGPCPVPDSIVARRLDALLASGRFVTAAAGDQGAVFRRAP